MPPLRLSVAPRQRFPLSDASKSESRHLLHTGDGRPGVPQTQDANIYRPGGCPLTFKTEPRLKAALQGEIVTGVFNPRSWRPDVKKGLKWRNYAEYYLSRMEKRTRLPHEADEWLSRGAWCNYEQYQRLYLIPAFGDYEISAVDAGLVRHFVTTMKDTSGGYASANMRMRAVKCIRHMLNFAWKEGDLSLVPEMPTVKDGGRVITTLTAEQQEEIIRNIPPGRRPIYEWLTATGRRVNEARAMQVCDVDFARGEYQVVGAFDRETYKPFPKTRRHAGAAFPLNDRLIDIYRRAVGDRVYGPNSFVFANPDESPLTHAQVKHYFQEARAKTGYKVTLNKFGRHSWATQRLAEGWSFSQVATFLLNTASVVERRYANVTTAVRRSIIDLHTARARKETSGGPEGEML